MATIKQIPIGYEPFLQAIGKVMNGGKSPNKQNRGLYCKMILRRLDKNGRPVLRLGPFLDLWKTLNLIEPLPDDLVAIEARSWGVDLFSLLNPVSDEIDGNNILPESYRFFLARMVFLAMDRIEEGSGVDLVQKVPGQTTNETVQNSSLM